MKYGLVHEILQILQLGPVRLSHVWHGDVHAPSPRSSRSQVIPQRVLATVRQGARPLAHSNEYQSCKSARLPPLVLLPA